MVSKFDDRIEYAIKNIWYKADAALINDSLQCLRDAANEGDGDAYYFLGRCYLGDSYVNPSLKLPLDVKFAHECFDMSLNFESAVGMFGAMYVEGYTPTCGSCVHSPYNSKREIWNEVAKKAYSGNVFCKYLLANAYYYGYITDFKGESASQYEWDAGALQLYEECADAGLSIAIPNLVSLLTLGRNGEPIQQKVAEQYLQQGADLGVGLCERMLGSHYAKLGNGAKALELYEKAIEHRDFYTYYYIGRLYTYKGAMGLDLDKALGYFAKGMELFPNNPVFSNRIGEIYFHRDKDYEKAFYYLDNANKLGSTWGSDMLGTCYLYGLGTAIDLNKARELFSLCPKKRLAVSGLEKLSKH
jgi:hypothetical protein